MPRRARKIGEDWLGKIYCSYGCYVSSDKGRGEEEGFSSASSGAGNGALQSLIVRKINCSFAAPQYG